MCNTFFAADALGTPAALAAALAIGFLFGLVLESAGFGSSRRLAGIFYLRDMTVLKVMFTAMTTACLGLGLAAHFGLLGPEAIYLMPTVYGAHITAGLLFGVGFVMGGWCPGTAAVGLASGSGDALLYLFGALAGSVLFNEIYDWVKPLTDAGYRGVRFAYADLGLSRPVFALLLTVAAVACFWGAEWVERRVAGTGRWLRGPFLPLFSAGLIAFAVLPFLLKPALAPAAGGGAPAAETALLAEIEAGADHIEPEELAERLLADDATVVLFDLRPAAEFARFHIRGARQASLPDLPAAAAPFRNRGLIVLYSNGMTHPAEARDSLARSGFRNARILTDGLTGFVERCLKPVSLRREPLAPEQAARVNAWRAFFLATPTPAPAAAESAVAPAPATVAAPALVDPAWLAARLGQPGLRVLDVRPQPEYNSGHIPGALAANPESFRGLVDGVPSMLLPGPMLAAQFSLLGLEPDDTVVLAAGDKPHDATLVATALARIGHPRVSLLDGGVPAWKAAGQPLDTRLPVVRPSQYRVRPGADTFTVNATEVQRLRAAGVPVIDVRPADYFAGQKSDEARAGHIPGARNRPFSQDVAKDEAGIVRFKTPAELAVAYEPLLPADKRAPVVVHCRTGHQASQTLFVLQRLLGRTNVKWYDAGWTEWAARPELPIEGPPPAPAPAAPTPAPSAAP